MVFFTAFCSQEVELHFLLDPFFAFPLLPCITPKILPETSPLGEAFRWWPDWRRVSFRWPGRRALLVILGAKSWAPGIF